jgi:hypothetical protein
VILGGGHAVDNCPELVFPYCPACAAIEFGYRPHAARGNV